MNTQPATPTEVYHLTGYYRCYNLAAELEKLHVGDPVLIVTYRYQKYIVQESVIARVTKTQIITQDPDTSRLPERWTKKDGKEYGSRSNAWRIDRTVIPDTPQTRAIVEGRIAEDEAKREAERLRRDLVEAASRHQAWRQMTAAQLQELTALLDRFDEENRGSE